MKKTVAVVVVSLCCWLIASAGTAVCKNLREAEIEIEVGDLTFNYKEKVVDPVPCIYRGGVIKVTADFSQAPNGARLKLSDFRAVILANPGNPQGGSWIRDYDDIGALEIWVQVPAGGDYQKRDYVEFKKSDTSSWSQSIQILGQRNKGVGPQRLLMFKLELEGQGNKVATFDPPWGERP